MGPVETVVVAVLVGGGRPLDGGRVWRGERILGDGKTWRGTAVGIIAGIAAALLLNQVQPWAKVAAGVGLPGFSAAVAISLSAGAMLGDVVASFLKRRLGRKRGAPFPVVDQLDFAVGALALTALVAWSWFDGWFLTPPTVLVAVLLATPLLHVGTNAAAYALGLKDEPW